MSTAQKLIAATSGIAVGSVDPIGIDFDGTNDYLYKSSDWTNNTNSKTFTFSAWFYPIKGTSNTQHIMQSAAGYTFLIASMETANGSIHFDMAGTDTAFPFAVYANTGTSGTTMTPNTWNHLLISLDTSDSNKRFVYINGVNRTSVTDWQDSSGWYRNVEIDFTRPAHSIGVNGNGGSGFFHGRLAGIYLDYTYRDLTTASNRYLFIDVDNQYVEPPTGSIISFPFDDASSPGTNSGTGGDYALTGTIAQSGRGPNQYNGAASIFDGVSTGDKLLRTSQLTNISDTKTGTFRFSVNSFPDAGTIISISTDSAVGAFVYMNQASNSTLTFTAKNSSGTTILSVVLTGYGVKDKWETHCITFDLTDTSKRAWLVDGVASSPSWNTYTNDTIDYTRAESSVANQYATGSGAGPFKGTLSDIWFDNSYTADLSVFYDTDTGKPKILGGDGSKPTGSSPKIYLPLTGNNAGSNGGTGGDYTVNSGPFLGARGPSEFWGESAEFNGSSQNLGKNSNLGLDSTRKFIIACSLKLDAYSSRCVFDFQGGQGNTFYGGLKLEDVGGDFAFKLLNSEGTLIINFGPDSNQPPVVGNWNNVLISVDLSSTSKRWFYINGTQPSSLKVRTYNTNGNTDLSNVTTCKIGSRNNDSYYTDGRIGFLYIAQEYMDLSVEANRLKFFDAFGYPVDLGSDGSIPTGTQPIIYMNKGFHSGTNLGSGGNFTPNNTPTDGGYVKGGNF